MTRRFKHRDGLFGGNTLEIVMPDEGECFCPQRNGTVKPCLMSREDILACVADGTYVEIKEDDHAKQ